MENTDIHIGIIGSGKIGTAIYTLLTRGGFDYKISIADCQENHIISPDDYHFLKIDNNNVLQWDINEFVKDKTLIINALPFQYNLLIYKTCLEYNIPYFDLSEDDDLDEWIARKEYVSPTRTSIPFTMPHCGLAPGISTIIASDLAKELTSVNTLKIRVGALSQHSSNKLKYHTSWSSDGLVNEYKGKCQVVIDGKYAEVPALCGYEILTMNGHDYETFNTSGGIGTFAKTLAEQNTSINADYKTIRRIGHHDYIEFLFNDLKLTNDKLIDIFRNHITQTVNDCVIIFIEINGVSKHIGNTGRIYTKIFYPENIYGNYYTAIELTTAVGIVSVVELFLNKKIPQEGYVKQESVTLKDILSTTFGRIYSLD